MKVLSELKHPKSAQKSPQKSKPIIGTFSHLLIMGSCLAKALLCRQVLCPGSLSTTLMSENVLTSDMLQR